MGDAGTAVLSSGSRVILVRYTEVLSALTLRKSTRALDLVFPGSCGRRLWGRLCRGVFDGEAASVDEVLLFVE